MIRKLPTTLAVILLCGLPMSNTQAASGLYLGAGVGNATIKDSTSAGNLDTSQTAYKAFVGYRFNMLPIIDLAVEGGYTDFGKASQSFAGQNVELKLHGANADALLIFPFGPFDFYGKAGVLSWSADSSVGGTTTSTTGTDPFYGVGVGFYLWKIGIRAEYEQYKIKDVDRVQMYSLNALFQF